MSKIKTFELKQSTIIRMYSDRENIDPHPEYQRNGDIWNLEKRQLLVDSIFNEFDIPKIYFHGLQTPYTSENKNKIIYAIIDGQQRMDTIWKFIDGEFALSQDFEYYKDTGIKIAGLKYGEIAEKYPRLKIDFDSFVLPVVIVETENDEAELIEEMFCRLNEAAPLNAAEKRNAIGGAMAREINDLSNHDFFKNKVRFSNKRYQYKENAAKLLLLEESIKNSKIIDTKKIYLDDLVKRFKNNSEQDATELSKEVKTVLNEMNKIFENKDILLKAQTIVPIYYILFRQSLKQNALSNISRNKLIEFFNAVKENRRNAEDDISKADYDLLAFDRQSIQGTNDAGSIKERSRIICSYFKINTFRF